jgi:CelD/BcsL family acetyltransferase involved in cellulose biosynthesis
LPLRISTRFGVRIGRMIGDAVSNSDSLIYDPACRPLLNAKTLTEAFAALPASGHPVDLLSFHSLLGDESTNPLLAFPHEPSPNHLYVGTLETPDGGDIESVMPRKRRNNLKRGIRRLTELFGEVELRQATTPEEIDAYESVFFKQRARRFKETNVKNIFGMPEFRRFYRNTARASLGREHPAMTMHAVVAGNEIVATSFGARRPGHYSRQIHSTAEGPASKYPLGGILLLLLLEDLRKQGLKTFDLGLGDFEYKTEWTTPTVVYDSIVPVTSKGRRAAPLLRGIGRVKRTIKQTPALWRVARGIQAQMARYSNPTP